MQTYQGPLGDAPLEPRISAPRPQRPQDPSFDAYADFGGRPLAAPSTAPSGATAQRAPSAQPLTAQAVSRGASPQQTPTQAQFASFTPSNTQDPDLVSPPLPTPTYNVQTGQPNSFAVASQHHANPGLPFQQQQPQQQTAFIPPPGSPYVQRTQSTGPPGSPHIQTGVAYAPQVPSAPSSPFTPMHPSNTNPFAAASQGAGVASPYGTPTIPPAQTGGAYAYAPNVAMSAPVSPHATGGAFGYAPTSGPASPHITGLGGGVQAHHGREETDATFYTAHGGGPSEYASGPVPGLGPNDPPLTANSAFTNPYQGYMTPPAQDSNRAFSPPPPSYHTTAR
jgi:hypothetical protein